MGFFDSDRCSFAPSVAQSTRLQPARAGPGEWPKGLRSRPAANCYLLPVHAVIWGLNATQNQLGWAPGGAAAASELCVRKYWNHEPGLPRIIIAWISKLYDFFHRRITWACDYNNCQMRTRTVNRSVTNTPDSAARINLRYPDKKQSLVVGATELLYLRQVQIKMSYFLNISYQFEKRKLFIASCNC